MLLNRHKNTFSNENEAKFVQERVSQAERNIAELCLSFGGYSRRAARLRDSGDELTTSLLHYANSEHINRSLGSSLTQLGHTLSKVNDYGDKRVQYLDSKVVSQLAHYESICKNVKEGVKVTNISKDKEHLRQRQLDRVKERNPRNRQQIVEAETELVQARTQVSRAMHELEDQITTFERQKLHDLKEILLDFLATEMGYHAKCLELLTESFQIVNSINEESDLQDLQTVFQEKDPEFKKALHLSEGPQSAPLTQKSRFRNSQSLGSLLPNALTSKKGKTNKLTQEKRAQSHNTLDENDDNEEEEQSDNDANSESSNSESSDSNDQLDDVKSVESVTKHKSPNNRKKTLHHFLK